MAGAPNFLAALDAFQAGREVRERNRLAELDQQGRELAGMYLQTGDQSILAQLTGVNPGLGLRFVEQNEARQDRKLDRDWRATESARAQGNQDRSFSLQQQGFNADQNYRQQQLKLAQDNASRPQLDITDVGGKRVVMDMRTGQVVRELGASPNTMQPRTSITDIGGKRVLVDENTGTVIKELGDSPTKQQSVPTGYQAKAGGKPGEVERLPGYKDIDLESKLRTEFQNQTKDFRDVRDAYNRIQASAQNPTPAGDLALIFNYMKMLDPGSVVRETEFSTAANAAPFLTRVGIDPNKVAAVWNGQRLTPEQRSDFLNRAQSLYGQQEGTFNTLAEQYRGVATNNGLDPGAIILTPVAPQQNGAGARRTKSGVEWSP